MTGVWFWTLVDIIASCMIIAGALLHALVREVSCAF